MTENNGKVSGLLITLGEKIQFIPKESSNNGYLDEAERGKVTKKHLRIKTMFRKASEQSFFLGLYRSFVRFFFASKIKNLGTAFFVAGIVNVISYFVQRYMGYFAVNIYNFVFGVCLILISSVNAINKDSVGKAIGNSYFFNKLFSELTGIKKWEIPVEKANYKGFVFVIAGFVIGILGVILTPFRLIFNILALTLICIIFFKPESALFLMMFGIFFLPAEAISFITALTIVSFISKLVIGKRSLKLTKFDIVIFVLMGFVILNSAFSANSDSRVLFRICMMMAFFILGKHLLPNTESFLNLMFASSLSLLLGSGAIVISGIVSAVFIDSGNEFFAFFDQFVTRENGMLISVIMPFVLAFMKTTEKKDQKLVSFAAFVLSIGAMFVMGSGGIFVAFLVGIVIFELLSNKNAIYSFIVLCSGGAVLFSVLPKSFVSALVDKTGILNWVPERTAASFKSGIDTMFGSFPFGSGFSPEGIETAKSTGSLFVSIGTMLGFVGFFAFIMLTVYFVGNCFVFAKKAERKNLHFALCGALCGMIAFVITGIVSGNFEYYKLIAVFFLFISLPDAARSVCRKEKDGTIY